MGSDVTLVLKADNSQHISKMKEAQKETQKVYDVAEKGGKREKGILEEIDATLVRLEKSKRKAYSYEDIEKYNKKIQEAKQNLEEYEKAGIKAEKQQESMIQTIGKWALGIGIVTKAIDLLKDAFLKTQQGMILFNMAGAAMNQVLSNIVNGVGQWNKGVAEQIILAKQLALFRIQEKRDSIELNRLMREYADLYAEGVDQMKSAIERLDLLSAAKEKYIAATKHEIAETQKELEIVLKQWKQDPTNMEFEGRAIDLRNKIEQLFYDLSKGTIRLTRQISGLENQIFTDTLDALKSFDTSITKEIDDRNKEVLDNQEKQRKKEGDANKEYYIQSRDDFFAYIDDINKKKEDAWNFEVKQGVIAFHALDKTSKAAWDKLQKDQKDLADAEDKVLKARQENLAAAGEAVLDYIAIIDELAQREVEEAQRQRELYDTKISEAQSALQTETELYKAGYASNVGAKQKELAELKKARDKALLEEEKARRKEHDLKVAQMVAERATAIAKVIMSAEVAKMEARAMMGNPITFIPGATLLASVKISEAISIAAILASVIAASMSKFAKGGWTGEGGQRDSTGERMAGIVHEREFVVKRGPANKYREVLEAINRDEKRMIFNSFNKISPEVLGTTVNNVLVENTGSNSRLDKLISENKKLNAQLAGESIQDFGRVQIVRKGNVTRTIRK